LRLQLDRAIEALLTEREKEVLRLRYGLTGARPQTLEEIGRHFDLTRERIRQIELTALRKLRHHGDLKTALGEREATTPSRLSRPRLSRLAA